MLAGGNYLYEHNPGGQPCKYFAGNLQKAKIQDFGRPQMSCSQNVFCFKFNVWHNTSLPSSFLWHFIVLNHNCLCEGQCLIQRLNKPNISKLYFEILWLYLNIVNTECRFKIKELIWFPNTRQRYRFKVGIREMMHISGPAMESSTLDQTFGWMELTAYYCYPCNCPTRRKCIKLWCSTGVQL